MNFRYKLLIITGFFVIFVIGYSLGNEKMPFNDSLKIIYQDSLKKYSDRDFDNIDDRFYKTDVKSLINIKTENEIEEKRKNLIKYIWKENEIPTNFKFEIQENIIDDRFTSMRNLEKINSYQTIMEYDVDSIAYLFIPKETNNKLVTYHQGHGGGFILGYETIQQLLDDNFTVLAFSMPLRGQNSQPEVNISNIGTIELREHDNFQFIETNSFSPIKFFVEPVFTTLNHIEKNYDFDSFHMIGLSGGAWTVTLYSAIDDRIESSYAVSGPLPRFLTINVPGNEGHYEANHVELLENANYLELFIMSSFGENRSHVKILNQFDPCCFYGTSYKLFEDEIKSSLSKMENGHFEIHIDSETRKHEISNESLDYIINNLKLNNRS